MKSQAGFTLLEALVAGTISTGIPLVVLATLQMNGSQLQKGSSRIHLTQVSALVSEEIYRTAYASASAKQEEPCDDTGLDEHCGVLFYNADGTFRRGFRVRRPEFADPAGILEMQTVEGGPWEPFLAGSDQVRVWTNLDGFLLKAPGHFNVLNPGAAAAGVLEGVRANLRLFEEVDGASQYLPVQTEIVLCRNALPPP